METKMPMKGPELGLINILTIFYLWYSRNTWILHSLRSLEIDLQHVLLVYHVPVDWKFPFLDAEYNFFLRDRITY